MDVSSRPEFKIPRVHSNKFFPAVAQTDAGLAVDVEN